jgi:hypothetical protein
MKRKTLLFATSLLMVGTIVGCGNKTTTVTNEEASTIEATTEATTETEEAFDGPIYATSEIDDEGNLIVTVQKENYAWEFYNDENVTYDILEDAKTLTYTIYGAAEGSSSFTLIGDDVDTRYCYIVMFNIDSDLNIVDDFTEDYTIIATDEDDEVEGEISTGVDSVLDDLANQVINELGENVPSSLATNPIDMANDDEMEYMLGTSSLTGLVNGAVTEPMMSSIAFSLVTLEFDTAENAANAAASLLETAPTEKWVCVVPDDVQTRVVNDNYVIMLMGPAESVDAFTNMSF